MTSEDAKAGIGQIRFELQLSEYLDKVKETELGEHVNLLTGREKIDAIFKMDGVYYVATTDNNSGEGLYYDLDDTEIGG